MLVQWLTAFSLLVSQLLLCRPSDFLLQSFTWQVHEVLHLLDYACRQNTSGAVCQLAALFFVTQTGRLG